MPAVRGLAVAAMLLVASAASAQSGDPGFRTHHFTLSAGLVVTGGYPVGDQAAELRRNATGNPSPVPLFRADSEFDTGSGFDARVNFAFSRALAVEVGASYSKPRLDVLISGDTEAGSNAQLGEEVSQYTVDVSGVWQVPGLALGQRARPYVIGGGGYLRQLHEGRLVADTGKLFHAGGGVYLWLTGGSSTARATGVRAEARFVRRWDGIEFADASRNFPAFSVMGFIGF